MPRDGTHRALSASRGTPEEKVEESLTTLRSVAGAALQLGAASVHGWSAREEALAKQATMTRLPVKELREMIASGLDPLGDAFCRIRNAQARRGLGQTYTPTPIITSMLDWASNEVKPERIVDPGSGSGRFTVAFGRKFRKAELVATDVDPLATLMTRAAVASAGMADRTTVLLADYRELALDPIEGATLFVGNPPYVRHHQIDQPWKKWLLETAKQRGHDASGLAGLHVHFFLATAELGVPGDIGAFITSAEWLDVNYGHLVRELLLDRLGGIGLDMLDPAATPFADAATTGVITTFRISERPKSVRLRSVNSVSELGALTGGKVVARERLAEANRWTPLFRETVHLPEGWIELGELCRVHRGTVTGANRYWVTRPDATELPDEVLFPSVTKARELFAAGDSLAANDHLRCVIDLPTDLDVFDADTRKVVNRFLRQAKSDGVADGYVARSRRAWWKVGLREPAPILATYMARRPPAFVRNPACARHINVAHGIYPRQQLSERILDQLARALRSSVEVGQGRTYAGGLTKFEPREMERVPVPSLELLGAHQ